MLDREPAEAERNAEVDAKARTWFEKNPKTTMALFEVLWRIPKIYGVSEAGCKVKDALGETKVGCGVLTRMPEPLFPKNVTGFFFANIRDQSLSSPH